MGIRIMWNNIKYKAKNAWLRFKKWWIGLLIAIGLVAAPLVFAIPQDFSWANPVTRSDGSVLPASELAEIRLYCDGALAATVIDGTESVTADLSIGSHTCYATAVDTAGQESLPSVSVTFDVLPAPPDPPTSLQVN